jgi:hypothetical protein
LFRQKLESDVANSWREALSKGRKHQTLWGHVAGKGTQVLLGERTRTEAKLGPTRQCSGRLVNNLARVSGTHRQGSTRVNGLGMVRQ